MGSYSVLVAILFIWILIFNLYQYSIRRIYEVEPILFNDLKLIKNAIVIVWSESKFKMLAGIGVLILFFYAAYSFLKWFLAFNNELGSQDLFLVLSFLWVLGPIYSIIKFKGLYKKYPNDVFQRYHFSLVEFAVNLSRSYQNYRLTKENKGKRYVELRDEVSLGEIKNPPNLYFFFIESYGSYYFQEESIRETSFKQFEDFQSDVKKCGYDIISSFSNSPTIGGQSWLTYTSALFGHRVDNNTLFENYLNDKEFRNGKSLLRLLRDAGYSNFNLNPINPINGINVPYEEMREMYAIDRWILSHDIQYSGNAYGFGACAPDQYSLNFTMDLIKNESTGPYTLFYLTKNSHSPFITPPLVDNWKDLNNGDDHVHVHKGFLKHPEIQDYQRAIKYEFEVINRFIQDHGTDNDMFVLIGDHQPPMLAKPEIHGLSTPVHIVSKNGSFLNGFEQFGFQHDLEKIDSFVNHEAFYSIFLNVFSDHYSKEASNIPDYEPEGIKF